MQALIRPLFSHLIIVSFSPMPDRSQAQMKQKSFRQSSSRILHKAERNKTKDLENIYLVWMGELR